MEVVVEMVPWWRQWWMQIKTSPPGGQDHDRRGGIFRQPEQVGRALPGKGV